MVSVVCGVFWDSGLFPTPAHSPLPHSIISSTEFVFAGGGGGGRVRAGATEVSFVSAGDNESDEDARSSAEEGWNACGPAPSFVPR